MTGPMGWLVKLLFIVMLAPFFVSLAVQLVAGIAVVVLPWLIALSVIAGLTAGVTAAVLVCRRLPPRGGGPALPPGAPPLGPYRVRRTRVGRRS